MECQSSYARAQYGTDAEDTPELLGWKAAADNRSASFSARSKSQFIGTFGLYPKSLVTSSTLDPTLLADVECWRLAMPDQSSRGLLPTDGRLLESMDPPFPQDSPNHAFVAQLNKKPAPGFIAGLNGQEISLGYREEPGACLPGTSSGTASLPIPTTGEVPQDSLIPFPNLIPWQVTAANSCSTEDFTYCVTSNETMVVPLPSIPRSHNTSIPQNYSPGVEYAPHSFETNFQISDLSLIEECEQISRTTPLGGSLNNIFVFGSSGGNTALFSSGYTSGVITTSANSQPPSHDTQDEEPDFTWTEIKATPTNSLYPLASDGSLQRRENATATSSQPDFGTLSIIHLNTPPNLPGAGEAPPEMDELMVNFETNPGARIIKGKRKAFGPEERKKVKRVRENGACFSCRARKVSCSEEVVCGRCLKAAQDLLLACQVCWRNKFKDIYIGVKDIHGSLLARKEQLENIETSLTGTPKQVVIWVGGGPNAAKLQLEVMQCQSSPTCRWKCLRQVESIYITSHFVHDQRYVIVPGSIPSIDRLDLFGRKILAFSDASHSGAITPLLDAFLLHYCRPSRKSRLRNLTNETLRIASLNGLVAYGFVDLHDGSYDLLSRPPSRNQRYVSETIHDQIRLRAAEGFGTAEEHIFGELDTLREIIGSNEHNRIVAGICLLRLILLYRERMVRDEIRLGLPRHGKRRTGHERRLEKAAFMYKRLTVVYGTLCRGMDSPMTMTWQSESGVGEDNQVLKATLLRLQAAYREFCDKRLTQQHDDIFKRLIVEPARKGNGKSRRRRAG